jgi:hypothetical protein
MLPAAAVSKEKEKAATLLSQIQEKLLLVIHLKDGGGKRYIRLTAPK